MLRHSADPTWLLYAGLRRAARALGPDLGQQRLLLVQRAKLLQSLRTADLKQKVGTQPMSPLLCHNWSERCVCGRFRIQWTVRRTAQGFEPSPINAMEPGAQRGNLNVLELLSSLDAIRQVAARQPGEYQAVCVHLVVHYKQDVDVGRSRRHRLWQARPGC